MIDGNWVDISTILFGFLGMVVKPLLKWRCGISPAWAHRDAINDFLNGAVIFPFLLLLISVVSSQAMDALVKHSKISLALAGFIGFLYVAKEIGRAHV